MGWQREFVVLIMRIMIISVLFVYCQRACNWHAPKGAAFGTC